MFLYRHVLQKTRYEALIVTDQIFLNTQVIRNNGNALPTDEFINQALVYLYRKATKEVFEFNSKAKIDKIAILKDQILFS